MEREHVDVLIVGAGLSGIGAACHLQCRVPRQELRSARGTSEQRRHLGPVPLPRHPLGLGHVHAGLLVHALAGGQVDRRRTTRSSATSARRQARTRSIPGSATTAGSWARWSSDDSRWTVRAERTRHAVPARSSRATSSFSNTGYYRYDEGYTPRLRGHRGLRRAVVHPQHWPEDLDYDGKRVLVIGSGATAVTLVPAMAPQAAHVTMLQRSPSYVLSLPAADPLADTAPPRASAPARLPVRPLEERDPGDARVQAQPARAGLMKRLLRVERQQAARRL